MSTNILLKFYSSKKVDSSFVTLDKYLETYNITQPEKYLSATEVKDALLSLS